MIVRLGICRQDVCRVLVVLACFAGSLSTALTFGQFPVIGEPATYSQTAGTDETSLARARALLGDVKDHVFSFDDEAFYWLCRHVRQTSTPAVRVGSSPDDAAAGEPVTWRSLLERPSDYRGQRIAVEGTLLTHNGFTVSGAGREDVGTLYQCELASPDTRGFCTIITTEDPASIPVRSRVRASGYFLKIRAYRTNRGETGEGPLIIARCLEDRTPSTPLVGSSGSTSRWIIPGTAALALAYLLLRRRLRPPPHPPGKTRSSDRTGETSPSASEDFAWLSELPQDETDAGEDSTK